MKGFIMKNKCIVYPCIPLFLLVLVFSSVSIAFGENILSLESTTEGEFTKDDSLIKYSIELPHYGSLAIDIEGEAPVGFVAHLKHKNQPLHSDNKIQMDKHNRQVKKENLGPDTYTLELSRSGPLGKFKIIPRYEQSKYSKTISGNHSEEKAVSIALDQTVSGLMGYIIDGYKKPDNYYSVEINDYGRLTLGVDPEDGLRFQARLTNAETGTSLPSDSLTNTATSTLTRNDLTPGKYLIRLYANTFGGYNLTAKFEPSTYEKDPEPNDSVDQAVTIKLNQQIQGLLGYISGKDVDKEDYYKLEVAKAGTLSIGVESEEMLNLQLMLLNSDKKNLGRDVGGNKRKRSVSRRNVEPGIYYIKLVRRAGSGGYSIMPGFTATSD